MSDLPFGKLRKKIITHESNTQFQKLGYAPLFTGSPSSKIVIIGQAPGIRAQMTGKVWDDASGDKLIEWLGVTPEQFRDERLFSHIPMDFYYPGRGPSGDKPPRKDFAHLWHPEALKLMPEVRLTVLIGTYAQKYYLGKSRHPNLTLTVQNYSKYLPMYFPLVHPSPLNFRWFAKNPWFEKDVVPKFRRLVAEILKD